MADSVPVAGADAGDGQAGQFLADKINHLFETIRRPDGSPHSNDEVAAAMAASGGPAISGTYLWLLRRGERDNPTKRHLEALAGFFDVSPAYFFDDAKSQAIARELSVLRAARSLTDAGVTRVATRLGGVSPGGLASILKIVEHVREIEGLDPATPSETSELPQPRD
jgi:transcriptional regulator with XRE-family HTH domain